MADKEIPYETINQLHTTLILLLKRICVIEDITMTQLVTKINSCRPEETSLHIFASLFCASYFAQSSTLQGHKAARHGKGKFIIKTARDCNTANHKRYDLSLLMPNDSLLSEDCSKFE